MRVLVLQTTRMGDVLQTSPLIRGIRRNDPDAHIAVVVRRMGKAIVERNPDVDEVIVHDEDELFLDLRAQDSDRLLRAYETADRYVQLLRSKHFDCAYNCTHSLASAMLLKLAEIPEVVGAHLSEDWQYVLRGRWVSYFFTSVFHREYNDLNLCDITRCFVDETPESRQLVFDVHDEDRAFVRVLLEEHGIAPDEYVACLQLGASEESKRWPESRFAELGRLLVEKRQARLLLVGVAEEAGLGEAFEKEAPGIASRLYGQTTIPQLAALLERANVLVTNDTGTMHIAAAVGCPVALVSVGYVHFRETGPYGPGHCAVEYRRPRLGSAERELVGADERGKVRAEQVLRAVDLVVEREGGLPQLEKDAELTDVDLFITGFAPDGCLEWYPVVRRPITAMDLCRIAYRAMWLNYLWDNPQREAEAQSIDCILRRYAAPPDNSVEVWEREEGKAFKGFSELAQKGSRITERLLDLLGREGSMRKAQELVAQLMALDEEMRVYGELHPSCRPLVRIARYERDNLEGADPHLLASRTLDIYRESCKRARLMRQKIERVAEAWERLLAAFRRDASR